MEPRPRIGRVLVVDDDDQMRRVCARVLAHEGWEVVQAPDARTAITSVLGASDPFDCVVSDVHMPEVDGFQLIAEVRRHDEELPILLMTGDPSLDGAVRAIDNGAVSYLTKPFEPETLVAGVARAARRHGIARMRRRADSYHSKLAAERAELEGRFERALSSVWMAFQPILELPTKKVFAYEALLRCDEPSLKRPDLLIATAERLDRIHVLGRTVRNAVATAATAAPRDALLFVNVHGLELTDDDMFRDDSPLAAFSPRVVLEITERIGLDPVSSSAQMSILRKLGYRIAVDDLGAGYAALGALATLEPEIVKLDMSLVRDIDRHPTKRRVVGAIATLCRELGSRVVAEGVETRAELEAITSAGVDLVQGYLFAKPAREFALVA